MAKKQSESGKDALPKTVSIRRSTRLIEPEG